MTDDTLEGMPSITRLVTQLRALISTEKTVTRRHANLVISTCFGNGRRTQWPILDVTPSTLAKTLPPAQIDDVGSCSFTTANERPDDIRTDVIATDTVKTDDITTDDITTDDITTGPSATARITCEGMPVISCSWIL